MPESRRRAAVLYRAADAIASGLAHVAFLAFLLLICLVCANAGARAFGLPLRGAVESSGLMGAVTASLALGLAQVHHNHITGGVALRMLPRGVRRGLYLLSCVLGAVFFAAAAWEIFDMALFTLEIGETVDGVGSLYPWIIMLTVPGFAGQAIILVLLMIGAVLTGEE